MKLLFILLLSRTDTTRQIYYRTTGTMRENMIDTLIVQETGVYNKGDTLLIHHWPEEYIFPPDWAKHKRHGKVIH